MNCGIQKLKTEITPHSDKRANKMIEYLSLVLGAIGTITGVLSLVWKFENQRPKMKIKVKEITHTFHETKSGKEIHFLVDLEIWNHGDRGTTINKIELAFSDDKKRHVLEQETRGRENMRTGFFGTKIIEVERKWVNPNELIEENLNLTDEYTGSEKDDILCIITLYHTRKTLRSEAISKKKLN
ncbi:MAG: hypothetical protein ACBZ72_02065 [Candidatus Bathyarchaeia archaeon]